MVADEDVCDNTIANSSKKYIDDSRFSIKMGNTSSKADRLPGPKIDGSTAKENRVPVTKIDCT